MRMPRPGPGNGWRQTISSGSPSCSPTRRTSSLNSVRSGSTSANCRSSGSPPTLWWLLMFAVPVPPPDSTTSGYSVPCTRNSNGGPSRRDDSSRAACSKTRMNSRPMILRFSSGSVTPASASRNCSAASTTFSDHPGGGDEVAARPARPRPARSRPWSTNTQVSWSPTARCTSAAATAESTPPDSPQITRLSPTCARIERDLLVDDVRLGPGRPQPGDVVQEVLQDLLAVLGVQHLGVELHAGQPARRRPRTPRPARRPVDGGHGEAARRAGHRVAVRHPHRLLRRQARAAARPGSATVQRGAAELRAAGVRDLAAERLRHRLEAVADAEHRHAGVEQRRVGARRARRVDRGRPAGQDDRLRLPGQHLGDRHRVRHDLGVDVAPRAPGGRSAARTAPRSRRRGRCRPAPAHSRRAQPVSARRHGQA